ncbi:hypothetical protein [Brevundimonas sp.]|uniref:hypothetical protein n=1 Tax=Brevundimonas sp. TaxID=1871086 RepID=UPI003F71FC25
MTVLVDTDILDRLERERLAMGEPNLRTTIRRRLEASGRRLAYLERKDLLWPPPRREQRCMNAQVSAAGLAELQAQARRLDVDERVLLTGVLADDLFASPLMCVFSDEASTGYLRSERGRGRIYGMRFEVPGYQYAFLKVVAGDGLFPGQVFELAVVALAERIANSEPPTGLRLSREAILIAKDIATGSRSRPSLGR